MQLDAPHVGFVLAAYTVFAVVVVILIATHLLRSRRTAQRLEELEANRVPRRPKQEASAT